jgi:Flp pilus assembly protein TadG
VHNANPVSKAKSLFRRYFKSEHGNVGPMTAFAVIPMFLAAGAAIDMARVNREQATFQAAVDSAVLAVAADTRSAIGGLSGQALADRISILEEFARKFINANYSAERGGGNVTLSLTASNQAIQIMAHNEFPTTIMKLAGVDSVELDAFAEVRKAMRPIEMTLVMDTTGSMANSGKMDGAKAAARQLLDILYGGTKEQVPESEYLRMSLVPFASAVKLNQNAFDYSSNWIDTAGLNPLSRLNFNNPAWHNHMAWGQLRNQANTSNLQWNGCVEARSRTGNLHINDTAPTVSNPDSLFPAYFAPDTPSRPSGMSESTFDSYLQIASTSNIITDNDYISDGDTPRETQGWTTSQRSNYAMNVGWIGRQENTAKYVNNSITNPAPSTTSYGPWKNCAWSHVVPMTYNRLNIEAGITAMQPAGYTMIPEGLAWGWRTISPGAPFTLVEGSPGISSDTIAPYNHARWRKVMVLMTDGDNDVNPGTNILNRSNYTAYGRGGEGALTGELMANNRYGTTTSSNFETNLDANVLSVCSSIKANGVELYVTSFGSGVSATTQNMLRSCATDDAHYTHASTNAALQAFFDHIGTETLNKSIFVSK